MNIVEKRLSELIPYKNNPKIHTDEQIAQIARSIELTKGLRQPIVIDANNVIVAGHGRFLAAKKLGLETVPCEMVDDLTEDEIRAYRLIDNRIASGEYDVDLEPEELESIDLDLADFGFDYSLDEDDYDDYDIGIDKKENARPMQSDAFENQELMQFDATSFYGIPDLRPTQITGDDALVWGGEVNKKTGKIEPWRLQDENGNETSANSYGYWKSAGSYMVRKEVRYDNLTKSGTYYRTSKVIRKSTVRKFK